MSRRKQKEAASEGGSWKGAFADFCMSMMTLFMVMWIVTNGDLEKKKALSLYFSEPGLFNTTSSKYAIGSHNSGLVINTNYGGRHAKDVQEESTLNEGANGDSLVVQLARLGKNSDNIEVVKIPGGMKISLIETEKNPMFKSGEYLLTPFFEDLLLELADPLKESSYDMTIVGHTDAAPYAGKGFLNNWTLSFARANSVREVVDFAEFPDDRILQVAGMADSDLIDERDPVSARNRRVELILVDTDLLNQPVSDQTVLSRSMANAWQAADRNQI